MGKATEKRYVVVMSWVCRQSVERQSWGHHELSSMSGCCFFTHDCRKTVMGYSSDVRAFTSRLHESPGLWPAICSRTHKRREVRRILRCSRSGQYARAGVPPDAPSAGSSVLDQVEEPYSLNDDSLYFNAFTRQSYIPLTKRTYVARLTHNRITMFHEQLSHDNSLWYPRHYFYLTTVARHRCYTIVEKRCMSKFASMPRCSNFVGLSCDYIISVYYLPIFPVVSWHKCGVCFLTNSETNTSC